MQNKEKSLQCFSTFLHTKSKGFYALFLQKQSFSLHFLFLSPIESDIMNNKYNLISLLNPFLLISLLLSTPEPPKRKLWYSFLGFFVPFLKSKKIFMNTGLNKYQVIERKASALLFTGLSPSVAQPTWGATCETNENSADYQSLKVSSLWISFIASMLNTHHLLSTGALALDSCHFRSNIKLFFQKNTPTPIFVPPLPLKFLYMRE